MAPHIDAGSDLYKIKKGDTLYSLSQKFEVSVQQLKDANQLKSNTIYAGQKITVPAAAEAEAASETVLTVKKGDTLYSLSKKYEVSVEDMKQENNLKTNTIKVGQKLFIPEQLAGVPVYQVEPGDTLWGLSHRFGVPMSDIKLANSLKNNAVLIGQKLLIPGNVSYTRATVAGAADQFTVEFITNKQELALKVPYGTAKNYQSLAGKKVVLAHKNGAVLNIEN